MRKILVLSMMSLFTVSAFALTPLPRDPDVVKSLVRSTGEILGSHTEFLNRVKSLNDDAFTKMVENFKYELGRLQNRLESPVYGEIERGRGQVVKYEPGTGNTAEEWDRAIQDWLIKVEYAFGSLDKNNEAIASLARKYYNIKEELLSLKNKILKAAQREREPLYLALAAAKIGLRSLSTDLLSRDDSGWINKVLQFKNYWQKKLSDFDTEFSIEGRKAYMKEGNEQLQNMRQALGQISSSPNFMAEFNKFSILIDNLLTDLRKQ